MIIGSHCGLSAPLMFEGSVMEALSYGATALMVYTGAPQSSIRRPLSELRILEARALMEKNGLDIKNLIIHAPYITNPASPDEEKQKFSKEFITEEVKRASAMGALTIVLHPGNAMDQPIEEAIKKVAETVNYIISNTPASKTVIALETMAGKGSEVGKTFEEVKQIIDLINDKSRIGVCLDTCHINDAGYDLVNDYENVIKKFIDVVGLNYLRVIHVNDSKNPMGAHKDRHENIGKGFIGFETLKRVCEDERFASIPKILETPYVDGLPPYKEEIALLKGNN